MRYRGDIQGLRAIAVLAVVIYHAGVPFLPGGYVGVDVFFVISGYLITGQLWQQLRDTGRIRFGDFYARRARRILPASMTVVLLTVIAAALLVPPLAMRDTFGDAIATMLYVPNFVFASRGVDYLAESSPSLFQHFWSLGIEEQFYFVWPLLLLGVLLLVRRRKALMVAAVGLIVVVSFGFGLWLTAQSQPWAFFSLPARAWELGAGGVLAILVARRDGTASRVPPIARGVAGWAGIAMILVACFVYDESTLFPGAVALLPVVGALLLIWGGEDAPAWSASRLIAVRPMQFFGTISYSMYLVHWPLVMIPTVMAGAEGLELWQSIGLSALSLPLAYLLYRFVEQPFRARGRAPIRVGRTFAAVGAASLLLVGVSLGAGKAVEAKPLQADVAASSFDPEQPVRASEVVPENVKPSLDESPEDRPKVRDSSDESCVRGEGDTESDPCVFGPEGAPTVALFGDSHAAQWFPALEKAAENGDIRLQVYVKNACPAVPMAETDSENCQTWRGTVLDELAADPPGIVLMGSFVHGALPDGEAEDRAEVWGEALTAAIDELPDGSRPVVMADTPYMAVTPAICLSGNVESADNCAVPREQALLEDVRQVEAETADVIDMTGHLCNEDECPPVVGDTLLYRDEDHLSASASGALADELWAQLRPFVEQAHGQGVTASVH